MALDKSCVNAKECADQLALQLLDFLNSCLRFLASPFVLRFLALDLVFQDSMHTLRGSVRSGGASSVTTALRCCPRYEAAKASGVRDRAHDLAAPLTTRRHVHDPLVRFVAGPVLSERWQLVRQGFFCNHLYAVCAFVCRIDRCGPGYRIRQIFGW